MNIRINKPLAFALALLALGISAYLFRSSLKRYHKPPILKTVSIESIQPGHMLQVETESLRYFVFKPISGEPYVLAVPLIEGAFYLPEQYWFKPHTFCREFVLDTAHGIIDKNSVFHCRDSALPDEWQKRWRWNALGKAVGTHDDGNGDGGKMDAMYVVKFERSDDELTFTGLMSR